MRKKLVILLGSIAVCIGVFIGANELRLKTIDKSLSSTSEVQSATEEVTIEAVSVKLEDGTVYDDLKDMVGVVTEPAVVTTDVTYSNGESKEIKGYISFDDSIGKPEIKDIGYIQIVLPMNREE